MPFKKILALLALAFLVPNFLCGYIGSNGQTGSDSFCLNTIGAAWWTKGFSYIGGAAILLLAILVLL